MKRTIILLALGILILAALAACNTPQPLPVAPTPIPTLIPATMPEAGLGAAKPIAPGVVFPSAPPSQAAGEAVYKANCASCHGGMARARWTRPVTSPMRTTCAWPRRSTSSRPSAAGGTRCRASRTLCPTKNAGMRSTTSGTSQWPMSCWPRVSRCSRRTAWRATARRARARFRRQPSSARSSSPSSPLRSFTNRCRRARASCRPGRIG